MMFATLDDLEGVGRGHRLRQGARRVRGRARRRLGRARARQGRPQGGDEDVAGGADGRAVRAPRDEIEKAKREASTRRLGPLPLKLRLDAARLPASAIDDLKDLLGVVPGRVGGRARAPAVRRRSADTAPRHAFKVAPTPTLRAELEQILGPAVAACSRGSCTDRRRLMPMLRRRARWCSSRRRGPRAVVAAARTHPSRSGGAAGDDGAQLGVRRGRDDPTRYTCDGDDDFPSCRGRACSAGEGARARRRRPTAGHYVHWTVGRHPADGHGGRRGRGAEGGTELPNSAGDDDWTGPCPAEGDGVHDVPLRGLRARRSARVGRRRHARRGAHRDRRARARARRAHRPLRPRLTTLGETRQLHDAPKKRSMQRTTVGEVVEVGRLGHVALACSW